MGQPMISFKLQANSFRNWEQLSLKIFAKLEMQFKVYLFLFTNFKTSCISLKWLITCVLTLYLWDVNDKVQTSRKQFLSVKEKEGGGKVTWNVGKWDVLSVLKLWSLFMHLSICSHVSPYVLYMCGIFYFHLVMPNLICQGI